MPTFFQIKFHAIKHPKTGAPWFIPYEYIARDHPSKGTAAITQEEDSDEAQAHNLEAQPNPGATEGGKSGPKHPEPRPPAIGAGAYTLARQSLLSHISRKTISRKGELMRLIPPRWKQANKLHFRDGVWRQDMDTYYLRLLRNSVLGKLKYLRHRNAGYLATTIMGLEGIPVTTSLGAVLWLGDPTQRSTAAGRDPSHAFPPEGPTPYLMVKYKGHHVPVYNMRAMLGDELLQTLCGDDQIFAREFVMLKAKKNTVMPRMLLWKLQIYTAHSQAEIKDLGKLEEPASKRTGNAGKGDSDPPRLRTM